MDSLTVFSQSLEVCLACRVSSLALVSHGEVLVGSLGIWRPQEPHCQACRSPCRLPSSMTDLRLCQPQWHWRIHEASPGPPPEIAREPTGGKWNGQRRERGRKKRKWWVISWRGTSLSPIVLYLYLQHKIYHNKWARNTELSYFSVEKWMTSHRLLCTFTPLHLQMCCSSSFYSSVKVLYTFWKLAT